MCVSSVLTDKTDPCTTSTFTRYQQLPAFVTSIGAIRFSVSMTFDAARNTPLKVRGSLTTQNSQSNMAALFNQLYRLCITLFIALDVIKKSCRQYRTTSKCTTGALTRK